MATLNQNNTTPVLSGEAPVPETDPKTRQIEMLVKKVIFEKLGLDEAQIKPDASFTDDLGIDSLDLFELVIEIENVFDISIASEEAEKLTTPGKLIEYLKSAVPDMGPNHSR